MMLSIVWSAFVLAIGPSKIAATNSFNLITSKSNRTLMHREYETHMTKGRIIGGENVPPGIYSWFARGTRDNHAVWSGCGGSLITQEFVLTAAHCVPMFVPRTDGYQIGSLCPNEDGNCGQYNEAVLGKRVFVHPGYDDDTFDNDFALVKLTRAVSERIRPVRLVQEDISESYNDGRALWAAGLGTTSSSSAEYPFRLQQVQVRYENNRSCRAKYGSGMITAAMMCASDTNRDSCQGDSGGPLYDAGNMVLVGVVSWGIGCAIDRYPGVYSRISAGMPWIEYTVCTSSKSGPPPPNYMCGCKSNESRVDIHIRTDRYGRETEWEITRSLTNQYLVGGGKGTLQDNQDYYRGLCIENGEEYKFAMDYPNPDGFNRNIRYTVFVNGVWNRKSNKKFTFKREFTFET